MRTILATTRQRVLYEARELWRQGFVTFDSESTGLGLEDQVIEIALCEPELPELPTRSWRIRPTVPIQEAATQVHGIRLEDLTRCPTYAACWPEIEAAINKRKTVMYNANFDYHCLLKSARAHQMKPPRIWTNLCVMT